MQEFVFAAKEKESDGNVPLFPNQRRDFVSNVNLLAQYVGLLRDQAPVLGNKGVRELLEASKTILKEVITDVHKGATPQGYRKIDIDLELNLQEEKQLVKYDKATVETNDGKTHTIIFSHSVYSLIDVAYQLEQGILKLSSELKVINTLTEIIPTTGLFQGMIRVKDSLEVFGEFSNVKNIKLYASKDTLHIAVDNGVFDYNWNKTTSSILTLHTNLDTFLDILNKITLMYEEILRILEEMRKLHKDVGEWHEEIEGWYNEILIMYNEIKAMKLEITNMYNEIKIWHKEIMEAVTTITNNLLGAAKVWDVTKDTVMEAKHRGCWINCVVPDDLDLINITIPEKDNNGDPWVAHMEFIITTTGKGTAQIVAGAGVSLDMMHGTAPLIKYNGKVCSAKKMTGNIWRVYGALEDL